MTKAVPEHEIGSGNVFADIGLLEAGTHLLKAKLVSRIQDILDERRLSESEAADLTGVGRHDLARILRGRFRDCSVERLMTMLSALGYEVAITLRPEGAPVPTDTIRLPRLEPA